jgi:hypothetical protein
LDNRTPLGAGNFCAPGLLLAKPGFGGLNNTGGVGTSEWPPDLDVVGIFEWAPDPDGAWIFKWLSNPGEVGISKWPLNPGKVATFK